LNLASATAFQTTLYNGTLNVTANTTQTANITVTAGGATLARPAVAVTPVNAGVTQANIAISPAAIVPSGPAQVDLVLAGAGFDTSLTASNFTFFGGGITLQPGSIRTDTLDTINNLVPIRLTLNVPAVTTQSLASFTVTNGSGTISFSGALVIVPPTPTFVAAGVVSSAAYTGIPGEVSPGGLYTIYDIQGAPNLGPAAGVLHGPLDPYNFLPATLSGVTVTFDGIPAPVFYAGGTQLNVQVPYELGDGRTSTQVVVNYFGSANAPVTVPVVSSQPLFFESCDGICAVNKSNGMLNTAQNPAPRGTYVEIYGTGVGKVSYTILTGLAAPGLPSGFTGNYTYSIGGSASAPAFFGGWTPTAIGLAQWDLLVPMNIGTGAVSVIVQDSTGANNQAQKATIFVQ
jgi:uncharacterized protein (TIGR03437 family)